MVCIYWTKILHLPWRNWEEAMDVIRKIYPIAISEIEVLRDKGVKNLGERDARTRIESYSIPPRRYA